MQKYEFESSQKIENCPQCGSAQLDQNNPFGKIECKNCLWLADASQFRPKSRRDLVRMSRLLFFGVLLFFTLAFGVQLSRWQRFSVDVSWFYLKRMVGQDGIEDWMNMGAICNSLKKFECSVSAFSAVLQKQARQRPALANLAMALGHLGQWREAQPYFEAYFSLGGEAYDTMFWYARALTALGEKERGIEWYFKSLKQNPQFMEAAKELVDGLVVEQRSEEALSLIAHLTEGQPEKDVYWGQKLIGINSYLQSIQEPAKDQSPLGKIVLTGVSMSDGLKLPSLSGDHYYFPVWLSEKGNVLFLLVDESQPDLILPRSLIDASIMSEVMENRKIRSPGEIESMELPYMRLGPWTMANVNISLCDDCPLRMGKRMLQHLNMKEWERHGVDFLTFSLKQ